MSPPATAPVIERIWEHLASSLLLIDGGSDYFYTLRDDAVYTELVNLLTVPQSPAVMIGPSEGHRREFKPSMRVRDRLQFAIEARVDADGISTLRKLEAFSRFSADIEKALTQDLTRGGAAVRTLIRPATGPFMGFGAAQQVLFSVDVEIDLIRGYGEP